MTEQSLPETKQRIDKWLWFARVVKSRSLAAKIVKSGDVRVNRQRINQASHQINVDDILTINLPTRVRILRVCAAGVRRGPAEEAAQLWEDLTPPPPPKNSDAAAKADDRPAGAGRPTKKQRRELDKFFQRS